MRAWQVITVAFCLLAASILHPAAQQDGSGLRLALVVGNARYPEADPPLTSTPGDAAAVAAELRRQGFIVDAGDDLPKAELAMRTERLLRDVRVGSTVVFYFSGYGIQSGRQNYLIPTDGNIWSETDVQRDGLNVGQLIGEISRRGAIASYVVLEGANRNPYERRFRNYSTGLAPIGSVPPGTTVLLSAAPGMSLRPPGTARGPFATELVKQMADGGGLSADTLDRTRTAVASSSGNAQVPWILSVRREPAPPPGERIATAPPTNVRPEETARPAEPPPKAAEPPPKTAEPPPKAVEPLPKAAEPPPKAAEPSDPGGGGKGPITPPKQVGGSPAEGGSPPKITPPPPKKPEIRVVAYSAADERLLKDLDAALARNPDDAASLYARGQLRAVHNDFARALVDFDRMVRNDPKDVEALNNRCWVRAVVDDLDAALADCNAALRIRPLFLDALDSRGFIMLKSGLPRRAVNDYDAALKLNAKHASSLYGRGLARVRLGETSPGNGDMKLALAIDPKIGEQFSEFGLR